MNWIKLEWYGTINDDYRLEVRKHYRMIEEAPKNLSDHLDSWYTLERWKRGAGHVLKHLGSYENKIFWTRSLARRFVERKRAHGKGRGVWPCHYTGWVLPEKAPSCGGESWND